MADDASTVDVPPHLEHDTIVVATSFHSNHSPPPSPLSSCRICHRQFARAQDLQRHIATIHNRTRPHVCQVCQQRFQRPYALRSHEQMHRPPQDHHSMTAYQRDRAYQRVKDRFHYELAMHFPDTPCAYCGTLLLPRNVFWISKEIDRIYPIEEILQRQPRIQTIDADSEVAVCNTCRATPQDPITGGPWPMTLLKLPQYSRMFLSPLTLNTNLGRTQGAQVHLNPYNTYRTVTGEHYFYYIL